MKFSICQINIRSVRRKAAMLAALTSILGGLSVSSSFADDGHDQRHNHHGQRDQRGEHDRHGDRRDHAYRRDGYAQPVYVPAPVYYEPRQSSGISLFFPLDFRR
jgi:ABC-type Zn2+ transport system substrate-binding protein/surface adhesin